MHIYKTISKTTAILFKIRKSDYNKGYCWLAYYKNISIGTVVQYFNCVMYHSTIYVVQD